MNPKKTHIWAMLALVLVLAAYGWQLHSWQPTVKAAPLYQSEPQTDVQLDFPQTVTFSIKANSDEPIEQVQLEYGLLANNCQADSTLAIPSDFKPGDTTVDTTWQLNMRRLGGSVPPGATIWYRWLITTASGTTTTPRQEVQWLDSFHNWQTLTEGVINLHWYKGDRAFAEQLLATAVKGQARIAQELNTSPNGDLHLYIYEDTEAMQDAMIFEPSWTGGRAFPSFNTVLIGISQDNIDWGMSTIAHELNHIIVDAVFDSCYGGMPTWLSEGLAMYAEGEADTGSQNRLERAIKDDTIFTMRELAGGFSEDPDAARLSYAQSQSIVTYLLETYDKDKMTEFLQTLAAGYHYESALDRTYQLTPEQLDTAWRDWVGAKPLPEPTAGVTAVPTIFPTYVPISGHSQAATPTVQPTSPAGNQSPGNNASQSDDDLWALVAVGVVALLCCVGIFAMIGLVIWLVRRNKRNNGGQ